MNPSDDEIKQFASSDALLRDIQERSEDIEKVVIPRCKFITITENDIPCYDAQVGMVLHLVSGQTDMLTPVDALIVLNDGILNRMRIPIEFLTP
jgi:hypothetical protein